MSLLTQATRTVLALMACLVLTATVFGAFANAEPDCPAESRITRDFDNGARWDLCWESRIRENLVLSDIYYTPPAGNAFKVLGSARLSQLHVAYDDSNVTYNDVTQYGLGGSYLLTLTQDDCPAGELLNIQTRPAACLWQHNADSGSTTPSRAIRGSSLNLFSVSQVGAYAYITSWTFNDDGSFEPSVGATGALQRSSDDLTAPFGRVLQGDPDTLWLSHTHNYYWRLDFDLGESATDDVVSELRYQLNNDGRRTLVTDTFITEQARQIQPESQVSWQIADTASDDAVAYRIEPTRNGHRFERKEIEPYTEFDFFVTVGNDCERFASQNARFNPDCLNHVLQFVDGQSVQSQDIVVWNRVSFHHTPRSEDQRHMHTHWDGFLIKPVNLLSGTSVVSELANSPPVFGTLADQESALGQIVHEDMFSASDADGDVLTYSAEGMPAGLRVRPDGHVHGYPLIEGRYNVVVIASDDHSETRADFVWVVGDPPQATNKKSGGMTVIPLFVLLTILLMRYTAIHKRDLPV